MNIRNIASRQSLAALVMVVGLFVSMQAGAAIKLNLSGYGDSGPSQYGFGAKGLFLGWDFDSDALNHPYTNWTWSDMEMTIGEDGEALIHGTMTRDHNNEIWGVNIQLSDMEFRKARPASGWPTNNINDRYKDGKNWSAAVTEQSFLDLAEGINPFTGADQSGKTTWGFEWKTLSMSLDKMGNDSVVPETGWTGFAMPGMGHPLVAELHYDGARGLTFEAWYKNPTDNCWYDVGDTKTLASVKQSQVPDPSGLVLLSLGLFGIGGTKIYRRA